MAKKNTIKLKPLTQLSHWQRQQELYGKA